MNPLDKLNKIASECERVIDGMLSGKMSRDDGLFAATATLRDAVHEFVQFATYALPILHTIDQAMRTAQMQAAQMQATRTEDPSMMRDAAARMEAAQPQSPQAPAPQEASPSNVVPFNANANTEIQKVDGTPGARR